MATFPTKPALSQGESPSLYKNIPMQDDRFLKAPTDGGYEFRRRRTNRAPRREIETGFLNIPQSDFDILEAFYLQHEQDVAFTWYDQIRDETYQVRFDSWAPSYEGIGTNKKWTIKIKMSTI